MCLCLFAKNCWQQLLAFIDYGGQLESVDDIIQLLLNTHSTQNKTLVAYFDWYLWYVKNSRVQ